MKVFVKKSNEVMATKIKKKRGGGRGGRYRNSLGAVTPTVYGEGNGEHMSDFISVPQLPEAVIHLIVTYQ